MLHDPNERPKTAGANDTRNDQIKRRLITNNERVYSKIISSVTSASSQDNTISRTCERPATASAVPYPARPRTTDSEDNSKVRPSVTIQSLPSVSELDREDRSQDVDANRGRGNPLMSSDTKDSIFSDASHTDVDLSNTMDTPTHNFASGVEEKIANISGTSTLNHTIRNEIIKFYQNSPQIYISSTKILILYKVAAAEIHRPASAAAQVTAKLFFQNQNLRNYSFKPKGTLKDRLLPEKRVQVFATPSQCMHF